MDSDKLIEEILDEVFSEIRRSKGLRARLKRIVNRHAKDPSSPPSSSRRRKPGAFDPMAVHRDTPEDLQSRLERLEVEELKDMIAEHGMDRAKLAMKWKSKERLIELIANAVVSRSEKGDAFRKGSG